MRRLKKRYLLLLLFPFGFLLNLISRSNSELTEKVFSTFIYKGVSWVVGTISGLLPVSLAEMLLAASILAIIVIVPLFVIKLVKGKGRRWHLIKEALINILLVSSVIYFAFVFMWGMNYNRLSLASIMGLDMRPSAKEELIELTDHLVHTANELRCKVDENEDGVMIPFGGVKGGFERYQLGYRNAGRLYPELSGVISRPKPIISSKIIAYTNIWGIYSPFTVESNVNMLIPSPMLLSTMMHEMAHQLGFAREDEANYIAYLTCRLHPDADYQYSGALLGLTYALNAVYGQDREEYSRLVNMLSDGVKRDLNENNKYHAKYSGPVSKAISKTNDIYLKANNQKDGERSYGRMLDLMLAEFRSSRAGNSYIGYMR
ncbi:MAG TPA: DUF3810 domain-containing protein [Candidatus Atribacteria bacterium]|nr:DUF3810 domain-containing protein [Candidatus Atribacteria bacterium]